MDCLSAKEACGHLGGQWENEWGGGGAECLNFSPPVLLVLYSVTQIVSYFSRFPSQKYYFSQVHTPLSPGFTPRYLPGSHPAISRVRTPLSPGFAPRYLPGSQPAISRVRTPLSPGFAPRYLPGSHPAISRVHTPLSPGFTPRYLPGSHPAISWVHTPLSPGFTPRYLPGSHPAISRVHTPLSPGFAPRYFPGSHSVISRVSATLSPPLILSPKIDHARRLLQRSCSTSFPGCLFSLAPPVREELLRWFETAWLCSCSRTSRLLSSSSQNKESGGVLGCTNPVVI